MYINPDAVINLIIYNILQGVTLMLLMISNMELTWNLSDGVAFSRYILFRLK